MKRQEYEKLKGKIIEAGYAKELEWAYGLLPVRDPEVFFSEYVWIVINAGMKEQVARIIFDRIMAVLKNGSLQISTVFKHELKCKSILATLTDLSEIFSAYKGLEDDSSRLKYLEGLRFVGPVTKFHLAKNLGITSVAKPDRHLVRIAQSFNMQVQQFCEMLSQLTGDTVAVVDSVLWRSANLGFI